MALPLVGVRLVAQGASKYTADLLKAETATTRFTGSLAMAGAASTKQGNVVTRSVSRMGNAVQGAAVLAGKAIIGLGAVTGLAAAAIGVSSVKTAANFEFAMDRVGAVSNATAEEMKLLSSTAREEAAQSIFTATEAADALYYLGLAGFDAQEQAAGLPAVLSLAAAGNLDLARASDIASDTLTGFGLEVDQFGRVADVMAYTSTNANTTVEGLGSAMAYVAPIAAAMGISIEETSAAIGIMADSGIKGTKAGTSLRRSLLNLAAPTEGASEAMASIGLDVFDAEGNFVGLSQAIQLSADAMAGLSQEERVTAVSDIYGAIAAPGILALMNNSEALAEFSAELDNAGGTADEVANRQIDNFIGTMKIAKSIIQDTQIAVGNVLLPSLTRLGQTKLLPVLQGINRFAVGVEGAVTAMREGEDVAQSFGDSIEFVYDAAGGAYQLDVGDIFTFARSGDFAKLTLGDLEATFRDGLADFSISIGDFLTLERGDDLFAINVNDYIEFTSDDGATAFSVGDFLTVSQDIEKTEVNVNDWISFIGQDGESQFKVGDFFTIDAAVGEKTDINVNDWISFVSADGERAFSVGDFFTIDADAEKTEIKLTDHVAFVADEEGANLTLGSLLDLSGAVSAGGVLAIDFNEMGVEIDTIALQNQFRQAFTDLNTFFTGTEGGYDPEMGTFVEPETAGISDLFTGIQESVNAELATLQSAFDEGGVGGVAESIATQAASITLAGQNYQTALTGVSDFINADLFGSLTTFLEGAATAVEGTDTEAIAAGINGVVEFLVPVMGTLATAGAGGLATGMISTDNIIATVEGVTGLMTAVAGVAALVVDDVDGEAIGAAVGDYVSGVTTRLASALTGSEGDGAHLEALSTAATDFAFASTMTLADALASPDLASNIAGAAVDAVSAFDTAASAIVAGIGSSLADQDWAVVGETLSSAIVGGLAAALDLDNGLASIMDKIPMTPAWFAKNAGAIWGAVSGEAGGEAAEAAGDFFTGALTGAIGEETTAKLLGADSAMAGQEFPDWATQDGRARLEDQAADQGPIEVEFEPGGVRDFFSGLGERAGNLFQRGEGEAAADDERTGNVFERAVEGFLNATTATASAATLDEPARERATADMMPTRGDAQAVPQFDPLAPVQVELAPMSLQAITGPVGITQADTAGVAGVSPSMLMQTPEFDIEPMQAAIEPMADASASMADSMTAIGPIEPPDWKEIIPPFVWPPITPLDWKTIIKKLDLSSKVPQLSWGSFVSGVDLSSMVPAMDWAEFITGGDIQSMIPPLDWSQFISTVTVSVPSSSSATQSDSAKPFARGTKNYPGGVGLGGEEGPEAFYTPAGLTGFLGLGGPELFDLPRGSVILDAQQTRSVSHPSTMTNNRTTQNNVTTNHSPVNHYNLAVSSLRSSERTQADFAMMRSMA